MNGFPQVAPIAHSQAVIRIVPRGGARTARQIGEQLDYLSRDGAVEPRRSERHQGIALPHDQLQAAANSWAHETGNYQQCQPDGQANQGLTTHIIVYFPSAVSRENARAAGRAWVKEMSGSGHNGCRFDYITAFHVDREHQHLHVVVNRRALEGHWLKVSRRHPHLNYDNMREVLATTARARDIHLVASSRNALGIVGGPTTYAEYRRMLRNDIALRPEPEPDLNPCNSPAPAGLGPGPGGAPGPGPGGGGGAGPGPGPGPRGGPGPAPGNDGPAPRDNVGQQPRDHFDDDIHMDDDFGLAERVAWLGLPVGRTMAERGSAGRALVDSNAGHSSTACRPRHHRDPRPARRARSRGTRQAASR